MGTATHGPISNNSAIAAEPASARTSHNRLLVVVHLRMSDPRLLLHVTGPSSSAIPSGQAADPFYPVDRGDIGMTELHDPSTAMCRTTTGAPPAAHLSFT
jgi:hypothetical protein